MKIYPPYKIFLNFVLIFLCIVLFFLIVPSDKYNIRRILPLSNSLEGELSTRLVRPPEISGLIIHPADEPLTTADSVVQQREFEFPGFINITSIEYPSGDEDILRPFISSLSNTINHGGQTRILYFGDSQLEGDRVTSFFRRRMQKEYGGSGPGMISIVEPLYGSLSVSYRQSPNWFRFDQQEKMGQETLYGLGTMLGYSRYSGSNAEVDIYVRRSGSGADFLTFDSFRLILQNVTAKGRVKYYADEGGIGGWEVQPKENITQLKGSLGGFHSRLSLELDSLAGSEILGLSLESASGILVDNIAHRGSAGLEFRKDKSGSFKEMAGYINPNLIILQFGINVVPSESNDFTYYKDYLKKEILYLQEQVPGVPILIVGVSDMGHLVDGIPRPYKSVEKISRVQRDAAEETGIAFYDLLTFMGGTGSFLKWIEEVPALMRLDYTHFSHSGGAIMAEGLARALIEEVDKKLGEDNGN